MIGAIFLLPVLPFALMTLFAAGIYSATYNIASIATSDLHMIENDFTEQDRKLLTSLGISYFATTGANAMRDWERLQASGKGTAVIVDLSHGFLDGLRRTGPEKHRARYNDAIARTSQQNSPEDLVKEYTELSIEFWNGQKAQLEDPNATLDRYDFDHEKGEVIELTNEQARARLKSWVDAGPLPIGVWPENRSVESYDFYQITSFQEGSLYVFVLPVETAFQALAYLDWRAPNNQTPAQTYATVKTWETRYGLKLVGLSNDYQIFKAEHAPQTREEALQTALEIVAFSTVEETNRSVIAFDLMYRPIWFLWWD